MKNFGNEYADSTFENIKHIDEYGNEYWYARELSKILEYRDWRNFQKVIDKAVIFAKKLVKAKKKLLKIINYQDIYVI